MAGERAAVNCKLGRMAVDPEITVTVSPEAVVVVVRFVPIGDIMVVVVETDSTVEVEIDGETTVILLVVIEVDTEVTAQGIVDLDPMK